MEHVTCVGFLRAPSQLNLEYVGIRMGKACVQQGTFPFQTRPAMCAWAGSVSSRKQGTLCQTSFSQSRCPSPQKRNEWGSPSDSWSFAQIQRSGILEQQPHPHPPPCSLPAPQAAASTLGDGPGWMMFFKRLWYWSSWTFCSFSNLGKLQRKRWVAEESQISRYHIYHQPEAGNNFPPQLQPLLTTSNWAVTSPPILVHWRTWSGWILKSWPDFTSTFISKVSGASTYLLPSISCFSWGPEAGSAFYEKRDLQTKQQAD